MNKQAFTLVELIVVITILAILATVWFVSFSGYLAWARDTNRIAQLKSMSDALELYRTKKDLPIPDDKVDVQASGSTIAYQWYIWANVLETIEYTEKGLDPKDKNYFSYYLTKNKKHFQLLSFLEEASEDTLAWNNIFNTSQAVDYSERVAHVKWKKLWILTDENNTPIQDVSIVTSDWYLDISDVWTTVYNSIISDEEITSWSWTELSSLHSNWSCKRIRQVNWWSSDWVYTIDPEANWVWFEVYCDMTTDWGGWTLAYKNDWDSDWWDLWNDANIWEWYNITSLKENDYLTSWTLSDSIINNLLTNQYRVEWSNWWVIYWKIFDWLEYWALLNTSKYRSCDFDENANYISTALGNTFNHGFSMHWNTWERWVITDLNPQNSPRFGWWDNGEFRCGWEDHWDWLETKVFVK